MELTENEYPLTIEILVDKPRMAALKKGQICKARYRSETNRDFFVLDYGDNLLDWAIGSKDAKVVK